MDESECSVTSKHCKYCKKSIGINNPKNAKCVNCESLYHASCALRVKTLIMVNEQENSVKCCSSENTNVSVVDMKDLPEESLRIEIAYLKMLLIEKDARINELIKINQLLEENKALVSGENEKFKNSKFTKVDNKNVAQMVAEKKQPPVSDNSYKNIVVQKHDLPVRLTRAKNDEALMNKQLNLMNEIINVNHDQTDVNADKPPTTNNIQDGFTEVKHRRQNKSNLHRTSMSGVKNIETQGCATVSETDVFRAKPSKMWLYVGKAMNSVTESIVKEYIINKCNITDSDEVEVYRLSSLGKSLAFQVGIDVSRYDEVNCADFWPKGIIIRRFHFDFKTMKKESIKKQNF
ncbi:hypothetical protein WA026_021900 [Henosepilachna vigintioctopunctata]|uniref:Uncharacterized protein n=1 Tax=Henosepilachna vigintioctopunctata TaxID=420089 RepID=A0AAW1UG32_9CUCU